MTITWSTSCIMNGQRVSIKNYPFNAQLVAEKPNGQNTSFARAGMADDIAPIKTDQDIVFSSTVHKIELAPRDRRCES